jgi:HK97 family phage portal protein
MGFLDNIFGAKPTVQTTPDFSYLNTRGSDIEFVNGEPVIDLGNNIDQVSPLPGVLPPSRSLVSRTLTPAQTLGLPAVWRAVSILTTAVSQLELEVIRQGVKVSPTPSLLVTPDSDDSLAEWLEDTVVSLALHGNAYWLLSRDTENRVFNITVLNPLQMSIRYSKAGVKTFVQLVGGKEITWRKSDIQHIRLMKVPGYEYGFGPIQTCMSAFVGANDLMKHKDNFFTESGVPTGILSTTENLDPEDAEQASEDWEVKRSTHRTAVLSNGLKYQPVLLSPKDAQFLESQQFSRTEIAEIFGIPAGLMLAEVNGNSMTYTNQEQATLEMIRFTLMMYLTKIESALTQITVNGQTIKFNLDGLLRPDSKTRADVQATYLINKVLTVDEVRAQEGLAPLTAAQKRELNPPKPEPAVVAPATPPANAPAGSVIPQKVEA